MTEVEALKAISGAVEVKIAKLSMKPGDVLVIQAPAELMHKCPPIIGTMQKLIPEGCKVVLLTDDVDLAVVGPDHPAVSLAHDAEHSS